MKKLVLALCIAVPVLASAESEVPEAVMEAAKMVSSQPPDAVAPAPMDGFYELVYGTRVFYVTDDGRYLVAGKVFDTRNRTDLTEQRVSHIRKDKLAALDEGSAIRFAPDDPRHEVYVFTDTQCGYCRKLHREVDELNELGIAVNYLAYPAISPQSRPEAVSVWCAEDPQEAMTRAKAGKEIESRTCDSPVDEHFALGRSLGVQGTPAIITDDGEMFPGYVPARKLAAQLSQGDR